MSAGQGIIVFARCSSARLPGKVLLDFGGMPLVLWVIRRAQSLELPVVLATSMDASDDVLAQTVQDVDVPVYRGALEDVLGRAIAAAHACGLARFARLCADRPFFDVEEMSRALKVMRDQPLLDLVSNSLRAPVLPGLTTEAVRVAALERAATLTTDRLDREHLTAYLKAEPSRFALQALVPTALPACWSNRGFAVDTAADYQWLSGLAKGAEPTITLHALARANVW